MSQSQQAVGQVVNFSAARYYRNAGDLFIYEGNYEAALKSVEKTLKLESDNVKAWVLKGDILFCTGRDLEALEAINQALELNPDCIEACISKASLLDVLGHPREGLALCEKAMTLLGGRNQYLLPLIAEQQLDILVDLRKYSQGLWVLRQMTQRLSRPHYLELHEAFYPLLKAGMHERQQRRSRQNRRQQALIEVAPEMCALP